MPTSSILGLAIRCLAVTNAFCQQLGTERSNQSRHLLITNFEQVKKHLLKVFRLVRSNLSGQAAEISKMKNLQQLDLSASHLTEWPDVLSELTQLRVLNLTSNQVSQLPESVSQLSHLHTLILTANQLAILPHTFADLTETLNASKIYIGKESQRHIIRKGCHLTTCDLNYFFCHFHFFKRLCAS